MAREQFTFYRSYFEALKDLPVETQAEALMAIADYALNDVEPELSGMAKVIFTLVKPTLDRGAQKAGIGERGGRKSKKDFASEKETSKKDFASEEKVSKKDFASGKEASEIEKEVEIEKEIELEKESITPCSPPGGKTPAGFDEFWQVYPNKTGKQAAIKTWSKLKPDKELTKVIVSAVEYQKTWAKWQEDGGRFVPNPATWLNQGRWEDEPPEGVKTAVKSGTDRSQSNGSPGQYEMDAVNRLIRQHRGENHG